MDTIVSDYGLAELLALPEHQGARPEVTPKGRGAADAFIELVWRAPADRRAALVKITEDYLAASNAQRERERERRLDEEWA